MILNSINIQGYRTLKDVTWQCGKLNVVIGPNGSGKSNMLQFLRLIQASAQGRLDKFVLSQGGMGAVTWDGKAREVFGFIRIDDLRYELVLKRINDTASFIVPRERLDVQDSSDSISFLNRTEHRASAQTVDEKQFALNPETFKRAESMLSSFGSPSPVAWDKSISVFQKELSTWLVLDSMHTESGAALRSAPVATFEETLDGDGQNFVSVIHTLYTRDRDFKESIDDAMSAVFGDEYQEILFPPVATQRIELAIRWKSLSAPQSITSLSDGTIRFLILATALAHPRPAPLIAIDEPETGLHPAMLGVVAGLIENAALKTQVIVTTHSPQLLDSFEHEVPTVTVTSIENGETHLNNVEGEALKRWAAKYSLGEMYMSGELYNMAEADIAA